MNRLAIQLCPNDHPPFAAVCRGHARALERCGYRVRTIFFERGAERPRDAHGSFEFVPAERLAQALGGERPALLVSHRYRAYRVGIRLARRLAIPRHIAVAHEFGFFARARRRWRRRLLGDGGCRFAGVSPAVAEELGASGVRAPLLLPNPMDGQALRRGLRSRAAARGALGLGMDAFAVGVVGRLHPKKDPRRALRAFAQLRKTDANARLVFLGDGELRSMLEREAGDGVVFPGFRTDGAALLRAFDVVLACATEREAFGLALLEALAAGVPVVCADHPGPRFVLGECAVYFDTDEALVEALQGCREELPRVDVEAGRRRAEQLFSVAALAERYRGATGATGRSADALC